MTLPPCPRSCIDHGFQDGLGRGGGACENSRSSPPAPRFRTQTPGGEMDGRRPLPPCPLRGPLPRGPVCSAPAGARRRRGARARLCARGAAERLPLRQPSPALREVPQSQWLPGRPRTALPAGARRRHPHLRPPSLLLLRRARLSPSLRTRAPAAPDLASERPGVARVPRSARRRRGRAPRRGL